MGMQVLKRAQWREVWAWSNEWQHIHGLRWCRDDSPGIEVVEHVWGSERYTLVAAGTAEALPARTFQRLRLRTALALANAILEREGRE